MLSVFFIILLSFPSFVLLSFCASLEFHISLSTPLLFLNSFPSGLFFSRVSFRKASSSLTSYDKTHKDVGRFTVVEGEKKKSQHRNQAAGEESRLMGDSGHAFSQKVTWQTNGSPVPLMHPIIIASDSHLPFSLFQKLPINLALKEFPPPLAATRVSITLVAAQNNTSRTGFNNRPG